MVLSQADKTLLVVFGTAIKSAVDLVVGVTLARTISQEDFGSYRQFLLIFGTLVGLTSLGLPQSLLYFVPKRIEIDAPQYIRRTFSLILGTTTAAVLAVALLGGWISDAFNNSDLRSLLWIGCLYPLAQAATQCLPFLLIALNRHAQAALVSVLLGLINGIVIVVPALCGASLRTIVWIVSALSGLMLGATLVIARRCSGGLNLSSPTGVTRDLLGYSLPLGANSMLGTVYQKLDRFLISLYYNPALLAVYSVGALELPVVPVLPYTVGRVLIPRFAELHRSGRKAEILPLWHRSIIKVGLLLLPIFFICFAIAPDMVSWLYGPDYGQAAGIFRIYLLLLPLRLTSYGAILQGTGDSRGVLYGTILTVILAGIIGVLLIYPMGWYGPAVGAVVTQVVLIIYLLQRIRLRLECSWRDLWPWIKTLKLFGAAGFAALPALAAAHLTSVHEWSIVAGIAGFMLAFIGLAMAFKLADDEDWALARRWLTLRVFS
jgi:O-antigen/teichoic acid export membrane protein